MAITNNVGQDWVLVYDGSSDSFNGTVAVVGGFPSAVGRVDTAEPPQMSSGVSINSTPLDIQVPVGSNLYVRAYQGIVVIETVVTGGGGGGVVSVNGRSGAVSGVQDTDKKGAPNGYAGLDAQGLLLASTLPDTASYKGDWSATANTPALANGAGGGGDFYRASTAGAVDFGAGIISFLVGDVAIYDGAAGIWVKIGSEHGSLQDAYSRGAEIKASNALGPVVFSAGNSSPVTPLIRVEPSPLAPTSNLGSGSVYVDSFGRWYSYDNSRSVFLSFSECSWSFGRDGNSDNQYLRPLGVINDSDSGHVSPYDCSITGIAINAAGGQAGKGYFIQVDGVIQPVINSIGLNLANDNLNIAVISGQLIRVITDSAGGSVNRPIVSIYFKRRA